MVKKSRMLFGILLLITTFAACKEKESKNLFEQEQDTNILAEEVVTPSVGTTSAENSTEEKDAEQPVTVKEAEEVKITSKPEIEDKPNQSEFTSDIDQSNLGENDGKGETVATLGKSEEQDFYYEEITDEIKARINGKSYGEACDVPYEELRYVKVLHWGFDGEVHSGELIVNKAIAEDIIEIFKELYEIEYPVERMVLVDEYEADDNASMADDNTSAFNYRKVEGTDRLSLHSYGMAIDINPFYNPYVHVLDGKTVVTPVDGAQYEDRTLDCTYYIDTEDPCYLAFIKRGFTWGGEWKNSKDYQHFQKVLE